MRHNALLLQLLTVLLLNACAGPQAEPELVHYRCNDGTRFDTRGGGDAITLLLHGEPRQLPRVHSGSGEKYTDRKLLFWKKGEESILASGSHDMVRCQAVP